MFNLGTRSAAASAIANSHLALQTNPLPPGEVLLGGPPQRGSVTAIRAALDQPQLGPARGINKGLIDTLFPPGPDPLGRRGPFNVFGGAILDTPPPTQQPFVKGASDVDAVSVDDIKQGQVGDCFLLGSLAAVARQDPQRIRDMVVDNGDGTYTVTFKERRGGGVFGAPLRYVDVPITVTADFPGGLAGKGHAASGDTGWGTVEIWPLVIEKAYGQYLSAKDPYGTLDRGGFSEQALEALTGRPATLGTGLFTSVFGGEQTFDTLLADFQAGKAIILSTYDFEGTLVPDHCYAVSNVYRDANGNQWVELYNPWGDERTTLSFDEARKRQIYTS